MGSREEKKRLITETRVSLKECLSFPFFESNLTNKRLSTANDNFVVIKNEGEIRSLISPCSSSP